jgi:hypothetical protein
MGARLGGRPARLFPRRRRNGSITPARFTLPEALPSPVPQAQVPVDVARPDQRDGGEGVTPDHQGKPQHLCADCHRLDAGCLWELDGELTFLCASCCSYCSPVGGAR